MALRASLVKKTFHFNFRAKTSRGVMRERESWFIKVADGSTRCGIGEAAPLAGLSKEMDADFENNIQKIIDQFNTARFELNSFSNDIRAIAGTLQAKIQGIDKFSSGLFAFETALLDLLNGGDRIIFKNQFVKGQAIPINGLIWMSGMDMMLQQIEIKIQDGFDCLKLKVGGLDFEKECDILQYIRRKYFKMNITLRLDANGAFKNEEALYKLNELSKFNIHSIEQPLKAGSPALAELCKKSPIPIALDEELIGVYAPKEMKELLLRIRPQFIILKPSLHGGLHGCQHWIDIATELNIGWWMTSALESNIGLNAIAQFTANFNNGYPQGLGTGKIYDDNFESPLTVGKGKLIYSEGAPWSIPEF